MDKNWLRLLDFACLLLLRIVIILLTQFIEPFLQDFDLIGGFAGHHRQAFILRGVLREELKIYRARILFLDIPA